MPAGTLHGGHRRAQFAGVAPAQLVVLRRAAQHIAAAVHPQQGGAGFRHPARAVQAQRDPGTQGQDPPPRPGRSAPSAGTGTASPGQFGPTRPRGWRNAMRARSGWLAMTSATGWAPAQYCGNSVLRQRSLESDPVTAIERAHRLDGYPVGVEGAAVQQQHRHGRRGVQQARSRGAANAVSMRSVADPKTTPVARIAA